MVSSKEHIHNFKASTNIKSLVGKDLVTDKYSAIYELVKNAFDAEAKKVELIFENIESEDKVSKLIIRDTGHGMTLDDFKSKWMVIGTNSKQNNNYSNNLNRVFSGDKGIGRFSTDRIGKKLKVYSYPRNSKIKFTAKYDWLRFEKYRDDISQLNFTITEETKLNAAKEGLSLHISDLRDEWNETEIRKLIENLRFFKNPFFETEFDIVVSANEFNIIEVGIESHDLSELSSITVNGKIDERNLKVINLDVKKGDQLYHEEHQNSLNIGALSFQIHYFDKGAKVKFFNRMKRRVKEYGNVRLYYDNFQVFPYGEPDNDWLSIDRRALLGVFRSFNTRDLIGYVELSKITNPNIKPATARQGLIDNQSTEDLKKILMTFGVTILEKYFFKFDTISREHIKESQKKSIEATTQINTVVDELKKTNPELSVKLHDAAREVEKQRKVQTEFANIKTQEALVYKRNSTSGLLLFEIIHQALININTSKQTSHRIMRYFDSDKPKKVILEEMDKFTIQVERGEKYLLNARDSLLSEKKIVALKPGTLLIDTIEIMKSKFEDENIKISYDVDRDLVMNVDKRDFEMICENFLSNSFKALLEASHNDKRMNVKMYVEDKDVILRFIDNGIGVPEYLHARIFDPFFSTTQGFGMGLAIVDEVVKEYKGTLNLAKNTEETEFIIRLRR